MVYSYVANTYIRTPYIKTHGQEEAATTVSYLHGPPLKNLEMLKPSRRES